MLSLRGAGARRWYSMGATSTVRERPLDRWKTYWKGVWSDYTTVAKDAAQDARQRPMRTTLLAVVTAVAGYCAMHNPDETSFTDQLLSSSAELGLVSVQLQNRESAGHLVHIRVMYVRDSSQNCCTYDADCKYLRTPVTHFLHRVVDIGFLDRWWILDKRMENYDVNT